MSSVLNKTGIGLGDYVATTVHGYRGRVTDVHLTGCPEDEAWQRGQLPPLTDEDTALGTVWFSLLVHEGGAVCVPQSRVVKIEPFDLVNNYADEYWPGG